ncbi:hypothetical protein ND2E_3151 [Colwellia psychrerythraea]|uniref:Uncharacterized protein n=1 Tax=Colwellia psychrerythraea TaxID=28229 RepID=A0A099KPT5_COLPS|nr:hypothetical protein ND2E_3151 [Colwellia psychrerythraea]
MHYHHWNIHNKRIFQQLGIYNVTNNSATPCLLYKYRYLYQLSRLLKNVKSAHIRHNLWFKKTKCKTTVKVSLDLVFILSRRIYQLLYLSKLVGLGRLELPTSPLSGVRSNQLSYRPIVSSNLLSCNLCEHS